LVSLYGDLTPWRNARSRVTLIAHCKDYIEALFTQYTPLVDPYFADDHAVMGGLARA
jgi:acetyl-CoA carboxylase carboxyl transferase subunit alpha